MSQRFFNAKKLLPGKIWVGVLLCFDCSKMVQEINKNLVYLFLEYGSAEIGVLCLNSFLYLINSILLQLFG